MNKGVIRKPIIVILLTMVTCGVYYYYWFYTTTKEIKEFTGDENLDPIKTILFMIITCGIYSFFWYKKMAAIVLKDMSEKVGIEPEEGKIGTIFILSILFQIIAFYMLQTKLNEIWEKVE